MNRYSLKKVMAAIHLLFLSGVFSLGILSIPATTYAQTKPVQTAPTEKFKLIVPIIDNEGNMINDMGAFQNAEGQVSIAAYIRNLYLMALGIAGLLAMAEIIYGALEYTLSAGHITSQEDARDRITQAVIGLVLLFGAYIILNVINPDLINLREPKVANITKAKAIFDQQIFDKINAEITKREQEQKDAAKASGEAAAAAAKTLQECLAIEKTGDVLAIAECNMKKAQDDVKTLTKIYEQANKDLYVRDANIHRLIAERVNKESWVPAGELYKAIGNRLHALADQGLDANARKAAIEKEFVSPKPTSSISSGSVGYYQQNSSSYSYVYYDQVKGFFFQAGGEGQTTYNDSVGEMYKRYRELKVYEKKAEEAEQIYSETG